MRGTILFADSKVDGYNNIVESISLGGDVSFADLRSIIPSIFDRKYVCAHQDCAYLIRNAPEILRLSAGIIGSEKCSSILNERLRKLKAMIEHCACSEKDKARQK